MAWSCSKNRRPCGQASLARWPKGPRGENSIDAAGGWSEELRDEDWILYECVAVICIESIGSSFCAALPRHKQVRDQVKEIKSAYKSRFRASSRYAYYMQPIPNSCRSGQKKKEASSIFRTISTEHVHVLVVIS